MLQKESVLEILSDLATTEEKEKRDKNKTIKLENNRESSMNRAPLDDGDLYEVLTKRYQSKYLQYCLSHRTEALAITAIISEIKAYCRNQFIVFQKTQKNPIPFDLAPGLLQELAAFKEKHYPNRLLGLFHTVFNINASAHAAALQCYLSSPHHTAWRYLSHPNPLHDPNSKYGMSGMASNVRLTHIQANISDYHLKKICFFWLAASDETAALEPGYTPHDIKELFIRELAAIGRAHNWDKTRNQGKVQVEYDDMELDNPTCSGGIERRLYQSIVGNSLCTHQKLSMGAYLLSELDSIPYYIIQKNFQTSGFSDEELKSFITDFLSNVYFVPGDQTSLENKIKVWVQDVVDLGIQKNNALEKVPHKVVKQFVTCIQTCMASIQNEIGILNNSLKAGKNKDYVAPFLHKYVHHQNYETFIKKQLIQKPTGIFEITSKALTRYLENKKNKELNDESQRSKNEQLYACSKALLKKAVEARPTWFESSDWHDLKLNFPTALQTSEDMVQVLRLAQAKLMSQYPPFSILDHHKIQGMDQINILGDGNCLFHSIYLGCVLKKIDTGRIQSAEDLRNQIALHLRTQYKDSIELIESSLHFFFWAGDAQDVQIFLLPTPDHYNPQTIDGRHNLSMLFNGETPSHLRNMLEQANQNDPIQNPDQFLNRLRRAIENVAQFEIAREDYCTQFNANLSTVPIYLDYMQQSGSWGGELELRTAAELIGVKLEILKQESRIDYAHRVGTGGAERTITLLHCQGGHYQLLHDQRTLELRFLDSIMKGQIQNALRLQGVVSEGIQHFVQQLGIIPKIEYRSEEIAGLIREDLLHSQLAYKDSCRVLDGLFTQKLETHVTTPVNGISFGLTEPIQSILARYFNLYPMNVGLNIKTNPPPPFKALPWNAQKLVYDHFPNKPNHSDDLNDPNKRPYSILCVAERLGLITLRTDIIADSNMTLETYGIGGGRGGNSCRRLHSILAQLFCQIDGKDHHILNVQHAPQQAAAKGINKNMIDITTGKVDLSLWQLFAIRSMPSFNDVIGLAEQKVKRCLTDQRQKTVKNWIQSDPVIKEKLAILDLELSNVTEYGQQFGLTEEQSNLLKHCPSTKNLESDLEEHPERLVHSLPAVEEGLRYLSGPPPSSMIRKAVEFFKESKQPPLFENASFGKNLLVAFEKLKAENASGGENLRSTGGSSCRI